MRNEPIADSGAPQHVLLTGAFGNVGAETLRALVAAGHRVTALDLRTKASIARGAELSGSLEFETAWVDIADRPAVGSLLGSGPPDVIIHTAAILPPVAYARPDVARGVNVGGTRNLIEAAEALPVKPRFVFTSSYSVHGPRNPHRGLPPFTGGTAVAPGDSYGCHKVECERMLRASDLPWTVLRLAAVARFGSASSREALSLVFTMPGEQPVTGVDVRDVATALARSIEVDCVARTFDIGGDDSWRMTTGELMARTFEAYGLPALPADAFRMADPAVDESWYFQDFVDSTEPQSLLGYQAHSAEDYFAAVRLPRSQRLAMRLAGPFLGPAMARMSPYHGRPRRPDPTPTKQVLLDTFGLDSAEAESRPRAERRAGGHLTTHWGRRDMGATHVGKGVRPASHRSLCRHRGRPAAGGAAAGGHRATGS